MNTGYAVGIVTHTLTPTTPAHAGHGTATLTFFGISLAAMILYGLAFLALRHSSSPRNSSNSGGGGGLSFALFCTLFGTICVTYPLVVGIGSVFDVAGNAGGALFGVGPSKFLTVVGCLMVIEVACVGWPRRIPWQPTSKEATYLHLSVAAVAPLVLALGYGSVVVYAISGWLNRIG